MFTCEEKKEIRHVSYEKIWISYRRFSSKIIFGMKKQQKKEKKKSW